MMKRDVFNMSHLK